MFYEAGGGTESQEQAVRDLVHLGFDAAIVDICYALEIDGGWLEVLALHEMRGSVAPCPFQNVDQS